MVPIPFISKSLIFTWPAPPIASAESAAAARMTQSLKGRSGSSSGEN